MTREFMFTLMWVNAPGGGDTRCNFRCTFPGKVNRITLDEMFVAVRKQNGLHPNIPIVILNSLELDT